MTNETQQPRPGYAGVTVWIGDKSITRVVPAEALDKPYYDPLAVLFADANAELRNAHHWGAPQSENRPANVRTCLPVVHPVDTSPERVRKRKEMDEVLNDALSNLEHDNYERSHKGYENRQADITLIRAALAAQEGK